MIYGATNYLLPNGGIRVNALINFTNDTELFALSGQDFFYQNSTPAWTVLQGPSGSPAFPGNTPDSKTSWAEWKSHLFPGTRWWGLTPESLSGLDEYHSVEAGGTPKTIFFIAVHVRYFTQRRHQALAVSLRTNMILHFASVAVSQGDGGSHQAAQSSTTLAGLSSPTSLATLITFIAQLVSDYNTHIADALILTDGGTVQTYHIGLTLDADPSLAVGGRLPVLNLELDVGIPTPVTLAQCVATLNDLRNKYNWHTYATLSHLDAFAGKKINDYTSQRGLYTNPGYTNTTAGFGKYAVTLPTISNNAAPIFSGQYSTFLAFVNNIKAEYNSHLNTYGAGNLHLTRTMTIK